MPSSTNPSSTPLLNFINGVPSPSFEGEFFEHTSPSDGRTVGVARSSLMDVVQAIQAVNRAQAARSKMTGEEKQSQIRNLLSFFAELLQEESSDLALTLAEDIGLPVKMAKEHSLPTALGILRATSEFFENEVLSGGDLFPSTGAAAVLIGWTDPLISFCRRVPIILASGNGVCLKPSSRAPRTAHKVSELFLTAMKKADIDLGLFSVLHGFGAEQEGGVQTVGDALLKHPGFKTVFWVGQTASAFRARNIALLHDKRFHFVGSGRNPAILFPGFDDTTLDSILTGLTESILDPHSRGPYRPSRLFVHESIYKETLIRLKDKFENIQADDPRSPATVLGPLPSREAENFTHQLNLALGETGHLVTGGERSGNFVTPTLVRDLTNCSTLQGEELAGPWATMASFKYSHEALKYANTSPLGLAAYLFHPDVEKATAVAQKFETSRVFLSIRPSWTQIFTDRVRATKQSASHDDGLDEIFRFGQWRSKLFR